MSETTRILLADDEHLVRKGIRHLLKDQTNYCVVADASDGLEATEEAAELQPDIIILDVKMPRMDGLEALEKIRAVSPKSKIIILSGYSSFEYAQRALKHGASDYLLKPVALEELLAVLQRVLDLLRQEKMQQESSQQMEERLSYSIPAFIEQFYFQLLNNELSEEELSEKMRILELEDQRAFVLLVGMDHSYRLKTSNPEKAYQAILRNLKAALESLLTEGRQKTPPVLALNNALFAMIYMDTYLPGAQEFSRHVLKAVKSRLQHTVSIAVSDSFRLKDLGKAFVQAFARLKQRLVLGGDRIIREDSGQAIQMEGYPHELERRLETAVRFGDLAQMKVTLRTLFRQLSARGIPSDSWQQVAFDIMEQGYQVARQMGLASATALEVMEKSREISLLSTWEDIQLWLETSLSSLVERIRAFGAGPSLAVKKARSFVEGHFRENIRLSDVAEHVCLSPNYLSQQLKLQTRKSFLEHMCLCRLEEAKRLLSQTTLSVSEIAYQVGYKTPRYFSEVFLRRYEMTPSQFRSGAPPLKT